MFVILYLQKSAAVNAETRTALQKRQQQEESSQELESQDGQLDVVEDQDLLGTAYANRGYSQTVVNIMSAARRSSSDRQYKVYYVKFQQYCKDKSLDPFKVTLPEGLGFLSYLHETGLSYSAVNTARSALSLILRFDTVPFGVHPDVVQFMKGLNNLKPSVPRYSQVWDLDLVLDLLKLWSPKTKLGLRILTMKTAMLVLIVSGQRPQILSKLNVDRMDISKNKVVFHMLPTDFKQGNRGSFPEKLQFDKFPGDKRICVFTYLVEYIQRTLDIRHTNKSLFLTVGTPHKAPSAATISRWIKTVLRHAGINTKRFSSGSVRAAVSSKAVSKGVSIIEILKLGGWTRESTFTRYYKKPIVKQSNESIQTKLLS